MAVNPHLLSTVPKLASMHRMLSVSTIEELRKTLQASRAADCSIGLVPTMGALHRGHMSLVRMAAKENKHVYVSLFVNPTQFGPKEDYRGYPRTDEVDLARLEEENWNLHRDDAKGRIHAVWRPSVKTMYPFFDPSPDRSGRASKVTIEGLSDKLEGVSRPVFFQGVATVVMKLLNAVQPDRVYFGQKDVQQTLVIQRLIDEFLINTKMVVVPTEREPDGLAMSSRNVYLGERRRKVAIVLRRALQSMVQEYQLERARTARELQEAARDVFAQVDKMQRKLLPSERALFDVEYISVADPVTLEEVTSKFKGKNYVISGAIKMHPLEDPQPGEKLGLGEDRVAVRLIDNITLSEPKSCSVDPSNPLYMIAKSRGR